MRRLAPLLALACAALLSAGCRTTRPPQPPQPSQQPQTSGSAPTGKGTVRVKVTVFK